MGEPADRRAVAKDDNLPGILRHLIPPPVDFAQEKLHARETLDVPRLAPDHTALLHGLDVNRSCSQTSGEMGELRFVIEA